MREEAERRYRRKIRKRILETIEAAHLDDAISVAEGASLTPEMLEQVIKDEAGNIIERWRIDHIKDEKEKTKVYFQADGPLYVNRWTKYGKDRVYFNYYAPRKRKRHKLGYVPIKDPYNRTYLAVEERYTGPCRWCKERLQFAEYNLLPLCASVVTPSSTFTRFLNDLEKKIEQANELWEKALKADTLSEVEKLLERERKIHTSKEGYHITFLEDPVNVEGLFDEVRSLLRKKRREME